MLNVDRRMVGLVVAGVSDVVALAEHEILPPPELGDRAIGRAIMGIGTRGAAADEEGAASLLLLDVQHLLRRVREERE